MFTAQEIAEFQEDAASLMTLRLMAHKPAPGGLVTDAEGIKVPGTIPVSECCGKVQAESNQGGDTTVRTFRVGGVERPVLRAGLHIPATAYVTDGVLQIRDGDRGIGWEFEVLEVGPPASPTLAGRRFLVVGVPDKSYLSARRLDVVEL